MGKKPSEIHNNPSFISTRKAGKKKKSFSTEKPTYSAKLLQ